MSTSTTIKRAFTDFSKEEAWLNEMSHEGKALVDYRGGRYTFVDDEPDRKSTRLNSSHGS
mgnify:CR=1 FL=1